jgi:hypothetical protein
MAETKHTFQCQETGCLNPADEYTLPDPANMDGPGVIYHYCWTHASDAGFCHECKRFFGGVESFGLNPLQVCAECFEALQDCVGDTGGNEEEDEPEHLLSFDELNLPKIDDPVNGIRATFERVAAEHPMKHLKCQKCGSESFTAHVTDADYVALYCDACEEIVYRCKATEILEFTKDGHVIQKTPAKERDN